MAKFTIEFEDAVPSGANARFELEGFAGSEEKSAEDRTLAQNLYFLIVQVMREQAGLKIPPVDKGESNER